MRRIFAASPSSPLPLNPAPRLYAKSYSNKNQKAAPARRPALRTTAVGAASRKRPSSRRRKKKGGRSLLRRIPFWGILSGILFAIALYVFILIKFFVDPFSFRWNAIYGEGVNPEGFEVRGIDISRYQEDIDWARLRNANIGGQPVTFAFIKATEGTDLIDPSFNENFYQARQNGILRGAYHFFSPRTDARQQARFFLRQVHLEAGDLPPVLDVETRGNLSKAKLQKAVKQWLDVVEQHYGVKPIIYTGYTFKMENLNDSIFDAYPYWIAHYYVNELQYQGQWTFWQYTDVGHVDGIGTRQKDVVDCNIFNGSRQTLLNLTIRDEQLDNAGL